MPERPADYVVDAANRNLAAEGVCFEFPNIEKIDILVTFRCNAACAHCITRSHPKRTEWLEEREVLDLLAVGAEQGKRYTSFTGGEPFLDFPRLLRCVRFAKQKGYFVCADSNAFWGVTDRRATDWVQRLVDAGLNALFPSADHFHLPFVSLDRVRRVVEACDRVGLPCEVNFAPGPDPTENERIIGALDLRSRGYFCDGLELTGNDVSGFLHLYPQLSPAEMDDIGSMHMGVGAGGDVYANVDISDDGAWFHGTPLLLGNIRREDLTSLFVAERERPILALTRTRGPREVDGWLRAHAEIGPGYAARFADRRYYSPTAYWFDLFHAPEAARYISALEAWNTSSASVK